MFENVCTLPLTAEVFAQAIHPTLPIFVVGLASGHVQAFCLPSSAGPRPDSSTFADTETSLNGNATRAQTVRRRSSSLTSTTGPINTVSTIWRTRRHKGSCRAVAFSTDGHTLFSTGTDGLLKAADALTGRVSAKIALPAAQPVTFASSKFDPGAPSTLLALSPQALVLGTDGGAVHIYTLDSASQPGKSPTQTFRPHRTDADPNNAEAIAALAALPPSMASSSGTSRAFVSAAGSTLAVTDIRKGVVACSIDQGDVLLAACCTSLAAPPAKAAHLRVDKRKKGANLDEGHNPNDKVLIGGSEGLLTLWNRGEWEDQRSRLPLGATGPAGPLGLDDGEVGLECLAVMPLPTTSDGSAYSSRTRIVAAGLGSGAVKLVEVRTGRGAGVAQVVGEVSHDERGVEGVVAVGFEANGGRLITAGGEIVKVWTLQGEDAVDGDGQVDTDEAEEDQNGIEAVDVESDDEIGEEQEEKEKTRGEEETDGSEEGEDGVDSDEEEPEKRSRKKRRKGKKENVGIHGHHGVLAFKGLD